ncbi:MAG: GNAT family N-acetyltransferase [Anaerolineae bacterium]|nr:GNAT family N-acetyltransferase [Anaerolineae bacterium]
MEIKLATPDQRETVIELINELWTYYDIAAERDNISRAVDLIFSQPGLAEIHLLYEGDEVAGYFILVPSFSVEYGGLSVTLDGLFVREPFRRRGLGRQIINFMLDRCREQGWLAIEAIADEENKVVQYFYGSHGFAPERWVHLRRQVGRYQRG